MMMIEKLNLKYNIWLLIFFIELKYLAISKTRHFPTKLCLFSFFVKLKVPPNIRRRNNKIIINSHKLRFIFLINPTN